MCSRLLHKERIFGYIQKQEQIPRKSGETNNQLLGYVIASPSKVGPAFSNSNIVANGQCMYDILECRLGLSQPVLFKDEHLQHGAA